MVRFVVLSLLLISSTMFAEDLRISEERRQNIETVANWLQGKRTAPPSSLSDPELEALMHGHVERPVCGTPIAADFMTLRHSNSASMDAKTLGPRPTYLPETFDSPAGHFKIHYSIADSNVVYQPNVITNSFGVPDYVYWTAIIADSVYDQIINVMGYPAPLTDDGYPEGGDARYDIFLRNLPSSVLGQTWPDSIDYDGDSTQATSFIEIDNDYSFLSRYRNRPLDIVRVTLAHEYFHAVQFGMDWREADFIPVGQNVLFARPWMEMSAVWMEEILYDHINDYYGYLPSFFDSTKRSIEKFSGFADLHPYASVVWPLFLTEYFDNNDMIRVIWEKCGELGYGNDFLAATQSVIDSLSGGNGVDTAGTENWATAFREFSLWNYFTGERAPHAPNGIGYQEKQFYPAIPDKSMAHHGYDSTVYSIRTDPTRCSLTCQPTPGVQSTTRRLSFALSRPGCLRIGIGRICRMAAIRLRPAAALIHPSFLIRPFRMIMLIRLLIF